MQVTNKLIMPCSLLQETLNPNVIVCIDDEYAAYTHCIYIPVHLEPLQA